MNKYLRYFSYVLRHKWFVFVAGIKIGVPLWRLIIHDWHKLLPDEFFPYVESFYGDYDYNDRPQKVKDDFDLAWLKHQRRNDHHWQAWLLQEDDGGLKKIEMSDDAVHEMVADWMGAGRAIRGHWNLEPWFLDNHEKIKLHKNSWADVSFILSDRYRRVSTIAWEKAERCRLPSRGKTE